MSARSFIAFLGVAAVIGLLGFGLLSEADPKVAIGDPVPDRELPRLDEDGNGRLADYRGRWILVNLWASWCGPCRDEAPALERFHRSRDELVVVGINVQDNSADALAFLERYPSSYPQFRSLGSERSDAFGAGGVPESFLVDPRGRLTLIMRGPVDEDLLAERVAPLLAGRAS